MTGLFNVTAYRQSVPRDYRSFDVAPAVQHVAEDLLQARQRGFASNVIGGANLLGGDQAEGPAHGFRRVMERGLERDLGIMQTVGIELHFRPAGTSAEEVHGATFADHFNRPLPGFGTTHRFDHDVAAALLRSKRAHGFDHVRHFGGLHDFMRAHVLGGYDLLVALHDRNHVAADGARHLHKHQSDGTAADDGDGVADFDSGLMQAAQDAGQGLG